MIIAMKHVYAVGLVCNEQSFVLTHSVYSTHCHLRYVSWSTTALDGWQ